MIMLPVALQADYLLRVLNGLVASGTGTGTVAFYTGLPSGYELNTTPELYYNHKVAEFDFDTPAFVLDAPGIAKFNILNPATVLHATNPSEYSTGQVYNQITWARIYNGDGDLIFYANGGNTIFGGSYQIALSVGAHLSFEWSFPLVSSSRNS